MKSDRHPRSYDNRGAEPHRPLPRKHQAKQRFNPRLVLVCIAILVAIATLYHLQSSCDLNSTDTRACVD